MQDLSLVEESGEGLRQVPQPDAPESGDEQGRILPAMEGQKTLPPETLTDAQLKAEAERMDTVPWMVPLQHRKAEAVRRRAKELAHRIAYLKAEVNCHCNWEKEKAHRR